MRDLVERLLFWLAVICLIVFVGGIAISEYEKSIGPPAKVCYAYATARCGHLTEGHMEVAPFEECLQERFDHCRGN